MKLLIFVFLAFISIVNFTCKEDVKELKELDILAKLDDVLEGKKNTGLGQQEKSNNDSQHYKRNMSKGLSMGGDNLYQNANSAGQSYGNYLQKQSNQFPYPPQNNAFVPPVPNFTQPPPLISADPYPITNTQPIPPTEKSEDPYEFTLKLMKFKEEEEKKKIDKENTIKRLTKKGGYLSISKPTDNDVIFDHMFINSNGLKESQTNWFYDIYKNEFVVPEEIKREDDITKLLRIESILQSMNLNDKKLTDNMVFRNPPILQGLEMNIDRINKRDKKEKIVNKIVKRNEDINFFQVRETKDKVKIRPPPNFLI